VIMIFLANSLFSLKIASDLDEGLCREKVNPGEANRRCIRIFSGIFLSILLL
jgi:hypothetical protein